MAAEDMAAQRHSAERRAALPLEEANPDLLNSPRIRGCSGIALFRHTVASKRHADSLWRHAGPPKRHAERAKRHAMEPSCPVDSVAHDISAEKRPFRTPAPRRQITFRALSIPYFRNFKKIDSHSE